MTEFRIIKTRFVFTFEGYTWEVDEFEGEQAPLIIAEVELSHSEESPTIPPFIKDDVSHDMRYTNSQLAQNPFSRW
jgi:adenylate cyclase